MNMDAWLLSLIENKDYGRLSSEIFFRFSESELLNSFDEKIFVVDENFTLYEIPLTTLREVISGASRLGRKNIIGIIRTWPTIPPHFLASDFIIASKLNSSALISITKRKEEIHILAMRGDWDKCLNIREKLIPNLFRTAEKIVPKLAIQSEPRDYIDEFSIGGRLLRIYPEISEEKPWKEAMNMITRKYLEATEFPQYIMFKLI